MKELLYKELRLVAHPTNILFPALSCMLLIPNYPYYVVFFYTSLGIFFACLNGRENHDIFYTVTLPVRKRDMVRARFCFSVLLELIQVLLAIPFACLRASFAMPGNQAGMDANVALFGFAFFLLGLFNWVFFTAYYKKPDAVGKAFALASVVFFAVMLVLESLTFFLPPMYGRFDMPDPQFLPQKLAILAGGIALYVLLTALAYHKSARSFEALDL